MIEIAAAVVGSALTGVLTAAGVITSTMRQNRTLITGQVQENREIVIRLTAGVENIGRQLEALHADIRADRTETYGRLRDLEQRTARLEGIQNT